VSPRGGKGKRGTSLKARERDRTHDFERKGIQGRITPLS